MAVLIHQPLEVEALCKHLRLLGVVVCNTAAWDVVRRCNGDYDLAETALILDPRPAWVEELAGPR
jgi:hypothetical protein